MKLPDFVVPKQAPINAFINMYIETSMLGVCGLALVRYRVGIGSACAPPAAPFSVSVAKILLFFELCKRFR